MRLSKIFYFSQGSPILIMAKLIVGYEQHPCHGEYQLVPIHHGAGIASNQLGAMDRAHRLRFQSFQLAFPGCTT
jgi:hypothetical protein